MYNFFIDENLISENEVTVIGNDFNHLKKVLRMRVGDEFLVSVKGESHLCKITNLFDDYAKAEIVTRNYIDSNLPIDVYLFQGLPKSYKLELIIQKAVELGVTKIIPVQMKRSVVKLDEKKSSGKVSRWQAIAESAGKQSKRNVIPEVSEVLSFKNAVKLAERLNVTIVPYENFNGMQATVDALNTIEKHHTVGVFIGPEGGFDDSEIDALTQINAKTISLGKRILRTETAAITTLSMLMLYAEIKLG